MPIGYSRHLFQNFHVFSVFSSQLQQLSFKRSQARPIPSRFPPFPNVKQLDIEVADPADGGDSLLDFISFIQACPMLHTFKLK
ncbi:hypothetical protein SOVF_127130, partial [Spinacia oleracea]